MIISARLCALNTLNAVFDQGAPLDQSLDKYAKKLNLSTQDKSFAHALCGFVLRHKPTLQKIINDTADRKSGITPLSLNNILLMGIAQIYFMNVPDHAAVDTSVQLAEKIKCHKQKGFVNAILRQVIRNKDKYSVAPALPKWLTKTWEKDYGASITYHLQETSLKEAPIGLNNKNGDWQIVEQLPDLSRDQWIQDFSSHYPVSLLDNLSGKHVFDLCAAPGGKTMQLAAAGAQITAVDISEKRLRRLQENLDRTNLSKNVDVVCQDLLKWNPDRKADIVLLDAPCSATGTIRRHPDLPYIRKTKDIRVLSELQKQLLNHTKDWVAEGGLLVYCTCSLQQCEGEEQIDLFLENNSDFQRETLPSANAKYLNKQGDIRLLPTYGDMDGFFISYLRKI